MGRGSKGKESAFSAFILRLCSGQVCVLILFDSIQHVPDYYNFTPKSSRFTFHVPRRTQALGAFKFWSSLNAHIILS